MGTFSHFSVIFVRNGYLLHHHNSGLLMPSPCASFSSFPRVLCFGTVSLLYFLRLLYICASFTRGPQGKQLRNKAGISQMLVMQTSTRSDFVPFTWYTSLHCTWEWKVRPKMLRQLIWERFRHECFLFLPQRVLDFSSIDLLRPIPQQGSLVLVLTQQWAARVRTGDKGSFVGLWKRRQCLCF